MIQVNANQRKSALFALIADIVGKRTGALITLAGPVFVECYTMKGAATSVQGRIGVRFRRRSTASPLPDCQAAFQRIAKHCAHLIQRSRRPAIAGDPEAIHVMRIELTRLRAAVLFFSPMVKDTAWSPIRRELGWLNSVLGKARDHDVTANYTQRRRFRRWARPARHAIVRAQHKAHRSLAKKLDSARYEHLMVALHHWIESGPWLLNSPSTQAKTIDVYSRARLRDWRKQISRKGRRLRALRRKQLHRLRIECKRYRYILAALQTLGVTVGRRDLAFADTAREAHRALGDLRDLKRLSKTAQDRPPHYRRDKRKLLEQTASAFQRHH